MRERDGMSKIKEQSDRKPRVSVGFQVLALPIHTSIKHNLYRRISRLLTGTWTVQPNSDYSNRT